MLRNHPKPYVHMFADHEFLFGTDGHARGADLVAYALVACVPCLPVIANAEPQTVAARDSPFTPIGHDKTSVAAGVRLA